MARILLISDKYPGDLTNGKHLRVFHLANELAQRHDCYFLGLAQGDDPVGSCGGPQFAGQRYGDERPDSRQGWLRHFRFSDARYMQNAYPGFFRNCVDLARDVCHEFEPELIITFDSRYSEVAGEMDIPSLIDQPDCYTLILQRRMQNRYTRLSMREKAQLSLRLVRARNRERAVLRCHDRLTTISEPDRQAFLHLSGVDPERVTVVPNGVEYSADWSLASSKSRSRSVVFWGNLDFPPNATAISFFYDRIFLPYLADKDLTWYIVGRGASEKIRSIGQHPSVVLTGFVEDLQEFLADKGVMINPMVEGSGLKNKVLESFDAGLPVVSSSMGVEAICGQGGVHFEIADEPEQFASLILQLMSDRRKADAMIERGRDLLRQVYNWRAVGDGFTNVVEQMASGSDSEVDFHHAAPIARKA